jgi:catechol 2,3-dioxygenase-like lactoylglutathione lyase family enzyme
MKEARMLKANQAIATVAVKDLATARKFYSDTLALQPTARQEEGTLSYQVGPSELLVYESGFAGTNEATAVTWIVDDSGEVARTLAAKGVRFEHYDDLPGTTRDGDLHFAGKLKLAWFKDPDGNIHSLVSSR